MHVRHGDFGGYCQGNKDTCYAPISVLAQNVDTIRNRLQTERGVTLQPEHVLVTSDEKDPNWWAEITQRGWSYVDHTGEQTVKKLGRWYPTVIDGIIQSMGTGFVGNQGSTMSLVALRRVVDWNDGIGVMVSTPSSAYISSKLTRALTEGSVRSEDVRKRSQVLTAHSFTMILTIPHGRMHSLSIICTLLS